MALGVATTMARARGAGLRPGQNCLLVSQKPAASYQPNGRVQWRITVHFPFSPPTQRSADLGHSQRSGAPGVTDLEEQSLLTRISSHTRQDEEDLSHYDISRPRLGAYTLTFFFKFGG